MISSLLGSKVSIAGGREDVCVNAKARGGMFGGQYGMMGTSAEGDWNFSEKTELLTPTLGPAERCEVLVPGIEQVQRCPGFCHYL